MTHAALSRIRRSLSSLLPVFAAGTAALYLWFEFARSHMWGDQAYLMYAAQQMLRGHVLDGRTLIETNPPFPVWFSVVPVGIARILHISPSTSMRFVTLAVLLGVLRWSQHILVTSATIKERTATMWLSGSSLALLLVQPTFFGQREHFVVILLFPYILVRALERKIVIGLFETLAIGALAGVAVCFKPQQLLAFIAAEVFCFIQVRDAPLRQRNMATAAFSIIIIYVLATGLFASGYFTSVLPQLRDTYWAFGTHTLPDMAFHAAGGLSLAVFVGWLVWFWARGRMKIPVLSGAFLACGSGAALSYDFQHSAWAYQRIPASQFVGLAVFFMIADLFFEPSDSYSIFTFTRTRLFVVLGLIAATGAVFRNTKRQSEPGAKLAVDDVLASLPAGTTLYIFFRPDEPFLYNIGW